MRLRSFQSAALALGLLSCSSAGPSDGPSVSINLDAASYSVPAMVQATLLNDGGQTLSANVCLYSLERREAGDWIETQGPSVPCPSVLLPWPKEKSQTMEVALGAGTRAGEYRIRYIAIYPTLTSSEPMEVASPTFSVTVTQ